MDSGMWVTQASESVLKFQLISILAFARKLINQGTGLITPKMKAHSHTHCHPRHQTLPERLLCTVPSAG